MGVSEYQWLIFCKTISPLFVFHLSEMELPGAFGLSFIGLQLGKPCGGYVAKYNIQIKLWKR